jgi:uncharacterized membrane protein
MQKISDKLLREKILEEKNEIDDIDYNIKLMKERLLERVPGHFSLHNIMSALFGALLIGLTFVLKGALVPTALSLTWWHVEAIVAATLVIIFIQVYFISYERVKDKDERLLGQFVLKRMISIIFISLIVSVSLIYMLNVNSRVLDTPGVIKVITLLWMACAIGSAIPGLLNKY